MMKNHETLSLPVRSRSGFTLLEMLISVGLLLMIISIFGQIFSIATTTIRKQRGIGVNDQKARTIDVIVRGDLSNISYKPIPGEEGITPMIGDFIADNALPLPFNENDAQLAFDGTVGPHPNMQGYVYISENDPNNDTDDVFQFTTQVSVDNEPYYVKATAINSWTTSVTGNDHPDFDDNILDNETSVSRQAEIVYYMRNGNLYRRVMAVRAPGFDLNNDQQPTRIVPGSPPTTEDLFANLYPAANNFYNDFDFSGRFDPSGHVKFNTMADLSDPRNRFGHYLGAGGTLQDGTAVTQGFAREFIGSGTGSRFFGRYTHEETSDVSFKYPQGVLPPGNASVHPMLRTYNGPQVAAYEASGRLNSVYPGPRVGEDILMSNVLSFDVKVWDDALGQFMDLGHGIYNPARTQLIETEDIHEAIQAGGDGVADGDYAYFQFDSNDTGNALLPSSDMDPVLGNKLYGDPHSTVINNNAGSRHFTFDTWSNMLPIGSNVGENIPSHPGASDAVSSNNASSQAPIRPLKYPVYRLPSATGLPFGAEDPTRWTKDPTTLTNLDLAIRSTHAVRWQRDLYIKAGDVVVPSYNTEYTDGSDPANPKLFTHKYLADTHRDIIAFRAKRIIQAAGGNGYVRTINGNEPFWNQIGGYIATIDPSIMPPANNVVAASPITVNYQVSNPTTQFETGTGGTIEWEKILNIQPLKAVKLTIQFRDVGSDQVRQLTLVHAFK
ncbi:PilW family protein [Lacunimicrobium album]